MHLGLTGWQREALDGDPREYLELFQRADALGFDSIWFNEYHFQREGLPYPSAVALAASVIGRTERMRIGLSVVLLPIHHPLLLAEELAQLDWQSGGRLDVGVGRGSPQLRKVFGHSDTETSERLAVGLDLLVKAWTLPSVASDGPFWQFPEVEVGPPPLQQPHPPLFVAGTSAATIGLAIDRRLPLLLSLEPPEGRQLRVAREVGEERHCPANLAESSLSRYVCIGATSEAGIAEADALRLRLHERRRRFARLRGEDPDALAVRTLPEFLDQQTIAGSPTDCLQQLQELVTATGMRHVRCMFNGAGSASFDTTRAAMELFAAEVLPAARAIAPPTPSSATE